jgi:hypothetical protein
MEKEITKDVNFIAYCGLYCATCRAYIKGKCPGCHENAKATWCKVRTCNMEHGYKSCADCKEYSNPQDCKMFNNIIAKFFALVFRSDRPASLALIKEKGYENYAAYMADNKLQVIKKK